MDELYKMIEEKIAASGYPGSLSGRSIYDDVCDQIENQENGSYLMLSRFTEDIVLEYLITVQDEDFDLQKMTIKCPEGEFLVDFDA